MSPLLLPVVKALWLVVLFGGNPVTLHPNESGPTGFVYRKAWYNKQVVYYVPFASSDAALSNMLSFRTQLAVPVYGYRLVLYTPSLRCVLDKDVLGDVYYVQCGQTVVFSTEPGRQDYTPLWRTHYLEWKIPANKSPVNSEAEVLAAINDGRLVHVWPISVLDATIVRNSQGALIKQACGLDTVRQNVLLPAYNLASGSFSGFGGWEFETAVIVLTEASDQDVAQRTGAYYVPALRQAADCANNVYAFVDPTPPKPPLPIGQLPVLEEDIAFLGGLQSNLDYSPLQLWRLMDRKNLSPAATVRSSFQMLDLLNRGIIDIVATQHPIVTNSVVLD